jgi:glycerol uptake operon antiterminator
MEGIGKDNKAIDYIAEIIKPSGIITTRMNQVKHAKEKGICVIQRFFLVDSQSYETAINSMKLIKPDMVEIMPAVMPKIISRFCNDVQLPIIAGGLINNKEDMLCALNAGALGISVGKKELWQL